MNWFFLYLISIWIGATIGSKFTKNSDPFIAGFVLSFILILIESIKTFFN